MTNCGVINWTMPNMIVSLIVSAQCEKTTLLLRSPLTAPMDSEMLLYWQGSGLHSYVLRIKHLRIYDWSWYWRVRWSDEVRVSISRGCGFRIVVTLWIRWSLVRAARTVPSSAINKPNSHTTFWKPIHIFMALDGTRFQFYRQSVLNLIKKNLWLRKEIYILLRMPFSRSSDDIVC